MIINILLCDTFPGLLPSYIKSYDSMFETLFNEANSNNTQDKIEYKIYMAMNCQLPTLTDNTIVNEIFLITGCNQAAYDNTLWIKNLIEWIREGYKKGIKLIGICFGHQAIALALGGKVEKFSGGWGVGIRESEILDPDMAKFWNNFNSKKLSLLYNHHDQVTLIPKDANVLATSPFCKYEGLKIGENILTFQGHPEYIPEYEKHLILNHAKDEPEQTKQIALQSIAEKKHQGIEVAKYILQTFNK